MSHTSLIRCRFSYSGRGFGFAEMPDGGEDIYIAAENTLHAMTGDTVLVHRYLPGEAGYSRGNEGEVVRIEARGASEITGTFFMEGAFGYVIPDDAKLHARVEIGGADMGGARHGDKVAVRLTNYPRRRRGEDIFRPDGCITRVFGPAGTREANYAAVLHRCGIPTAFSEDALWEAEGSAARALSARGRTDLRDVPTLTIDGADAKDLDDAISLARDEGGWVLGVHIADVSEYVKEGGTLDREAYERGTSVYFVDKVVPMLPTALSNGACSLNGGEDRYALSAFVRIGPDGTRLGCEMKKTLIRSDVRGVYSEVNDIFARERDSAFAPKYAPVLDMLLEMRDLYRTLRRAADARGQLSMESPEVKILLDGKGLPVDIEPRVRGEAEMMIEQFMLAANMGAAAWLRERNMPCLYRIHEDPLPEKIRAFAVFAHNMGLDTRGVAEGVTSARLGQLLAEAEEKGIADVVSSVLLRSLAKAKYSERPGTHYGLAADLYCHFTSPIRRYPDLFVHRSVSSALSGGRKPAPAHPAESARVSTDAEIRAVTAERQIEDLYMAQYASFHLGEEYEATVSSVCAFGVFARTEKYFEGLVPVEALFGMRTRVEYSEESMTLSGGGRTYRLGDRIRVTVTAADVTSGKIDFAPAGEFVPDMQRGERASRVPGEGRRSGEGRPRRQSDRRERGGKPRGKTGAFSGKGSASRSGKGQRNTKGRRR